MAGARLSAATLLVAFVVMAAIIVTAPAPTPGWSGPADRSERALGGRRSADEWDAPSRREAGARTLPSREGAPGSLDRPDHPSIPVSTATIVPDEIAAQPRSSTAIRLVWDSVPQAIGYLIHRSETPSSDWTAIAEIADGETAYTDTGLESNTTYFYRIAAVVEDGPAPPSDIVSATTPVAPPAATEVSATSDPLVTLTWFDVGDETGYRIERSSTGTDGWAMIGTTGQDVTAYTDGDLAPGTYHYRVVAVNEGGDSQPSNVVAVTVPEQEPGVDPPPSNGSDSEEPSDPEVSNGSDSVEPSDPEATSGSAAVEPSEPEATEASLSITPSAST